MTYKNSAFINDLKWPLIVISEIRLCFIKVPKTFSVMGPSQVEYVRLLHINKRHTLCPNKKHATTFSRITNNKCPITIIFGIVSSQSRRHRKMVSVSTSPIQCNYLTLGNHRTQEMTNFTVSNILFCEYTTFCDTFDCWNHLMRHQDIAVILAVHLHPRVKNISSVIPTCDKATDTITDMRSRRLGSMYRFLL